MHATVLYLTNCFHLHLLRQPLELIYEVEKRGLSSKGSAPVLRERLEVALMSDLQIVNKALLALAANLSQYVSN